jgi:hypothetical protein
MTVSRATPDTPWLSQYASTGLFVGLKSMKLS